MGGVACDVAGGGSGACHATPGARWNGADDCSARVRRDTDNTGVLTVVGKSPGNPRARVGLFRLTAELDGQPAAGVPLSGVAIQIVDAGNWSSPRLSGMGTIILDFVVRNDR